MRRADCDCGITEKQHKEFKHEQNRLRTMQKSNSQYDSFLFWRQPIPELDLSELKELGLTDGLSTNGIAGKDPIVKGRGEAELSEFSSFNFWRTPLADVDALLADLNLLL
ncbi:protein AF1q isoform X2 [Gouania willdenowi]|uniref:protein AF1q isoform X2 n=1 Tax=Gouania willdenowi TaxID=441366 RepID=UPI00105446A7|nr:protein AF1q isoform X2 [Gouania willdenowi]